MQPENHIETLIQNLSDSFNREMGGLRQEVRETAARIEDSVNRIERVTERHSKMISAGLVAVTALSEQSAEFETLQKDVADMKTRLGKLEGGRS
jgi:uncharacterized coiled-coil DUF342 family protein